jgi:hypothetical protein
MTSPRTPAYTELSGRNRILGREPAEILGVKCQDISRIAGRLHRSPDRTRPPAEVWIPKVNAADARRLAQRMGGRVKFAIPLATWPA